MALIEFNTLLQQRLQPKPIGRWDVVSTLEHFALITYAVPIGALEKLIPTIRFDIASFNIDGALMGLISAVPFEDADFRFARVAPWMRFRFGQTNHRAYVIDKRTGEPGVWFFGTTLGSPVVQLARGMWRIPWHQARYNISCTYNSAARCYTQFRYEVTSDWCGAAIEMHDTCELMALLPGFESLAHQVVVLTHPTDGFYRRLDGRLGTYSVWHKQLTLTMGTASNLYFSLYEKLGLLNRRQMQRPHSVLICPKTEFHVHLPPHALAA